MNRILDAFRVTELLKRNTNTRGMQGKDLKNFLALVDALKQIVVEDIVQVMRDTAEIRMRRAGYLRYTNRASFDIIKDRYTTKNWKTGGNIVTPTTDCDPVKSAGVEDNPPPRYAVLYTHGFISPLPLGRVQEFIYKKSDAKFISVTKRRASYQRNFGQAMVLTGGIWRRHISV